MDHLLTEARNPASMNLDELTPLQLVQLMNHEDSAVITAVASEAESIARAIDIIADRLRAAGRLLYIGAGTSGRLGVLDATECPPTFNSAPGQVVGIIAGGPQAITQAVEGAEDRSELAERDLESAHVTGRDVVVGIATSGRTPYVLAALKYAKREGAYTISLSCNPQSEVSGVAELAITPVVGPEVLSGSTRLKAGTATKLVLNMLSTGAMVRLGKTYGNLMVDLRATNSKLRARSNRILRTLTGISSEDADTLLSRCGGELKTAIIVQQAKVPVEEARAHLRAVGGEVGQAMRQITESAASDDTADESNDLVLGIDGGGTHTVALLAKRDTDGRLSILGRGEAGPSNLQAVGIVPALAALDTAVTDAFAAVNRSRGRVAFACLGLAGAGRAEDQRVLHHWAREAHLADHVEVTTDAAILLAAGTPDNWGLAIVAGTGSIAYGHTADGRAARAGGWGHLLGDEGSGYALALSGLQAVARAADQRLEPTMMTERFLQRLNLSKPQGLIRAIYQGRLDRQALAGLAPLVLEAAQAGDAVASALVENAMQQLAETALAVARVLGFFDRAVPVALAGGVLLASEFYRQGIVRRLGVLGLHVDPVSLVKEPADGALRIATAKHLER